MTEHPLTDEKCMSLFSFERLMDESRPIAVEDSMRVAADWQLEQVIEWLQENLLLCNDKLEYCYLKKYPLSRMSIDKDKVIEDLKQVMRPQENKRTTNAY
jgi:hypothetical protein